MPIPRTVLCACLVAATTVAGCTYYQTVPAAPSGPSTVDRAWSAALGAADDVGVAVSTADRTSGTIYGTTRGEDVTIRVFTQADGRVSSSTSRVPPVPIPYWLSAYPARTTDVWVGEL